MNEIEKSHFMSIGPMKITAAYFFASSTEIVFSFLYYIFYYNQFDGWWNHPTIGGVFILVCLFVLSVIFGFIGYYFTTHPRKAAILQNSLTKGNLFILINCSLGLAFIAILVLVLKPEIISHTPMPFLQKHQPLSYLAMLLILQTIFVLLFVKAIKHKAMIGKSIIISFVSKVLLSGMKMVRREFFATSILFASLILLFFSPTLIQGKLPLSSSYLRNLYPWAYYRDQFKPDEISNNILSDEYDGQIPAMQFFLTELRHGEYPSWNPYINSGLPDGLLFIYDNFSINRLLTILAGTKWGSLLYMCVKIYLVGIFFTCT